MLPKLDNPNQAGSDASNKKFMDTLSKPANKSVFGLLLYIRTKGNKAFNNLNKFTQKTFQQGKQDKVKVEPDSSKSKTASDLYTKEEKSVDLQQEKSLQTIVKNEDEQEDLLKHIWGELKKMNSSIEDSAKEKKEKSKEGKEEEQASGTGIKIGSPLKKAGELLRKGGQFVPGKAGKILRRGGAKLYGMGRGLNNKFSKISSSIIKNSTLSKVTNTLLPSMGVPSLGSMLGDSSGIVDTGMNIVSSLPSDTQKNMTKATVGGTKSAVSKIGEKTLGKDAVKGISKIGEKGLEKTALKGTEKVSGKLLGNIGAKVGGKALAKTAGKALGKSLLKKIPGVGLLAGLGFGFDRLMSGDILGAVGEVASGTASTIPGVGTAVSAAIDAGLAAKDMASAAGEENVDSEQLGEQISEQVESSPEAQQIESANKEIDMSPAEQKQVMGEIAEAQQPKNLPQSSSQSSKESPKEGFGNLLSTAFKYSPLGLMSNMVSSGIEGLTGMNPLKEVGNMLGITSNEEPSSLKPKVGSDSAIPVKIVSGEMPTDMALQMKDATLKDKIPEAGGNTYVNAPSTVSYQNNSAGEEPSVPSENINIGDPYLMEAARGNFSMV